MKAIREEVTGSQETATSFKVRRRAENTQEWKEKPVYGQFVTGTEDHHIEARRQDLVLVNKSKKSCHIIDVAIPEDSGVKEKEAEKYQNLTRELRRMWEVKTKVVPIVLGALRTVPLRLKGNLKDLGVDTSVTLIYPEGCTAGISKDTKKSIGNVKVGTRKHFGVPWQLVVAQHHNNTSR